TWNDVRAYPRVDHQPVADEINRAAKTPKIRPSANGRQFLPILTISIERPQCPKPGVGLFQHPPTDKRRDRARTDISEILDPQRCPEHGETPVDEGRKNLADNQRGKNGP